MKRILAVLLSMLTALPASIPAAYAQEPQQQIYAQQDLDRMLAPIALYPDALLSQILMAATYPIEVVEAARWSRANPGLQGEAAVQAVQGEDWDPSVKSLVAFPQVLQRLDENLQWTRSLGDAFLAQQPQVMDTVQQLRQRAQAAGNLQSNGQLVVQQQAGEIYIEPVNPQVVYVPYYDPMAVYYQPAPFQWGLPVALSVGFFFARPDWHRHAVHVVHPVVVNRTVVVKPGGWHHDPNHRRGVAYRSPVVTQRFSASSEQHRYQRPPGRDLHDSKVLSPAPRPHAQVQPHPQPRPQAQAQPQPRPQPRPQAQAKPQPRPQIQQDERRHAREDRRESRQEARQAERQDRSHPRGKERS